jgi:COMPASS component SWD3
VFCVNFHPNVSLAVSGSFDETVRIWNLQRDSCHRTIAAHSEAVTGVDFNRDGSILASSSYDGLIRLWDSSNGQCLKTLDHGESSPIGNILFSPNSFQLLATSLDNSIRLWDIANSRVIKTYLGHHNEKYAIKACFSAFGSSTPASLQTNATKAAASLPPVMVVAGSEDSRIYLWDLQTKKIVQTLTGHKDTILAVATHPRLSMIASASLDHDPCIKVSVCTAVLLSFRRSPILPLLLGLPRFV